MKGSGGEVGRLNLFGATMVGVGAMVGAGIFVLCGVALDKAGPAAIVAFVLNGVLSVLTAMSFAELASAFPESGGSYVFAKKVFPIGGAFVAGWVLWFAYIAACALYALGFAGFLAFAIHGLFHVVLPGWFRPVFALAVVAAGLLLLGRKGAGAGGGVSLAKLVAFGVLIILGLAAFAARPEEGLTSASSPFLPFGIGGIVVAMGYTFIALEGFEVIAAVGEEVRQPQKNIPRAMFLSIGITVVVYVGLMFAAITVGGPRGGPPAWRVLGKAGEDAMAVAAGNYAGSAGAVIVVLAGLLATFSALVASLLAASRVSFSMARDRALPRKLSETGGRLGTPVLALGASAVCAGLLVLVGRNVEVAGAAASLIFLVSFALTNAAGLLVRLRVGAVSSWLAPFYPLTPILGITACLGLAIFQAVVVPTAALVVLAWLLIGAFLYRLSFGARARTVSARAEAWDADLIRLRGRTPLVLVPMANPERADALLRFAWALATPGTGRVHALTVVPFDPKKDPPQAGISAYDRSQTVIRHAVETACRLERPYHGTILLAPQVTDAIARAAAERHPETVLLGMSDMSAKGGVDLLTEILGRTTADVVVLNAPSGWSLDTVKRILLPVGGRVPNDPLRARLAGMLLREGGREARLLRILAPGEDRGSAERELRWQAEDLGLPADAYVLEEEGSPIQAIVRHSEDFDLLVLGSGPGGRQKRLIGPFTLDVVRGSKCPVVAIAQAAQSALPLRS